MISYEDLDLQIRADGQGFEVSARLGSSQATSEPLELDPSRFGDFWERAERGPMEAEAQGSVLFDALIRGRIHELYQQGRGGVRGDAAKGLRIRILLDPRDERLRPLLRVPWEILFERSADAGGTLSLDPRRPVVRAVDSLEPILSPVPGPLRRVLLVMSSPRSLDPLDLESECAKAREALARIAICPEILKQPLRAKLLERIGDGGHQVVHFMGHGMLDADKGEGLLLLEDEKGGLDYLPASTFAGFFAGRPAPRLVVLAACSSAETGRDSAFAPFASVATALVAAGLPAVVAMQTSVRNRSAIRFTERLYRRLVLGDPVEAAVSQARIALRAGRSEWLDWGVPVLFVRGQAGRAQSRDEPALKLQEPPPLARSTVIYKGDGGIQIIGDVGQIVQNQEGKRR